ncbi:HTH domain-containing protein [Streptomyces sp. WAC01280]|uniref:HTH domain-containing protein n=1 Tax=Streptomyces sp. WAC01280 TaxID=2487424 RepID=UPI000F7B7496|nr:HTH domain-containing protein [Streptomyces sp. WAC01280]RSS51382.1 HTH domain-containing protein [Streptomyces sp. WAC01280]
MTTATATDETAIATRRARVVELLRDNVSQRDIATRLGVSKDVIYRDVQALARGAATPPDQEHRAPSAPEILAVALPAATPPQAPATPSRDTATPAAPCLAVPLDGALLADLATLTRNGTTPEDALRRAVAFMARAYRQAWERDIYPRDANPVIGRYQYETHQRSQPQTVSPPDSPPR